MKVFISWSGKRSRAVAEFLSEWMQCVLQSCAPWISTRDIDRGALWFGEIGEQLQDTSLGIICLTQENKNKPWILFEAGALAKGLTTARVCPLLIDLKPADVQDPLAQFNLTTPDKGGIWNLILTLNKASQERKLEEKVLAKVFDTYWPEFEKKLGEILAQNPPAQPEPARSEHSMLEELLTLNRDLLRRVANLERAELVRGAVNSVKEVLSTPTDITPANLSRPVTDMLSRFVHGLASPTETKDGDAKPAEGG